MVGFEVWLVVATIFFIGEMFTEGFFLLWFGVGALLAAVIAFLGVSDDVIQWIVFLLTSGVLVLLTTRFARKITKKAPREATVDALIGRKAKVVETINPDTNQGRVRVKKDEWRADADEVIPEGEEVEVLRVEGTHVVVKKISR
jgi:membrane protein implicated in regulation of membrane protease activity